MKLAKAALGSSLLLLGGILAHHFSGSSIASFRSISSFFILSLLLTLFLLDEEISDTKLFAAVFLAQNGAHFLMGGSVHKPFSMYFGHTIAGVLSFIAINKGSEILASIDSFVNFLYSNISPNAIFFPQWKGLMTGWAFIPYLLSFKELAHNATLSLRAPPRS
jgi:hypothetical protein